MMKKLITIGKLKKKLQSVFNHYIRLRDSEDGYGTCISCRKAVQVKGSNAGHYFTRGGHPAVRYDEDNVHLQCIYCNLRAGGNIAEYSIYLEIKLGEERFEALRDRRFGEFKRNRQWYLAMIEKYKQKVKDLE